MIELRSVRSLLEKCEVFDRVGSCKENVRRNVRCLFELGVVRSLLGEIQRYSIELRAVRILFGECEVTDGVWSFKEKLRRNVRCLFELGVVRSLLGEILRYSD